MRIGMMIPLALGAAALAAPAVASGFGHGGWKPPSEHVRPGDSLPSHGGNHGWDDDGPGRGHDGHGHGGPGHNGNGHGWGGHGGGHGGGGHGGWGGHFPDDPPCSP